MQRTYIKDIKKSANQSVLIKGFVHTIREQGSINFLLIRDVTGIIQVVITKQYKNAFENFASLTLESVVEITGTVKQEKQAPSGYEIEAENITTISKAALELPIPVVTKGGEETHQPSRLDWRWIDLRKPENLLIFKIWTELEKGFRKYWDKNGYIQFYSPSFMSAPSESGAEVFEIEYFNKKAYLSQSPQFYKQMALAAGFEKVFTTGPVFRAEPSFTTRHLTEFTGWDFEKSYIESHHEVMAELEGMMTEGFNAVKKTLKKDLEIPAIPFPKVTMKEAKEKLKKAGIKSKEDCDVNPEEERHLSKIIKKETKHDFVFLTDWPIQGRPFYHMRYKNNKKITKSFDLLYKGIEISTGAQREHRIDILEKQATEEKMPLSQLQNYFNFFRYGCPPHGGAGLGPARIIMKMLDLPNIREATFLPRDVKRLTP